MKGIIGTMLVLALLLGLIAGCGGGETGRLGFSANGEDFVRQGFVSKDGWQITFDHVYVNLEQVTGYQTDPPYDTHAKSAIEGKEIIKLDGLYTVDLAEGGENAPPILFGEVEDAPAGHYNALSWRMTPAGEGPAEGYSLVIIGTAERNGEQVAFTFRVENEYRYSCGEYVGDERKGFLEKEGAANLELTFHFDHIFGDATLLADDDLNINALGFDPFENAAENGEFEADMTALRSEFSSVDYGMLVDILTTLGHVGEGHCYCETLR